MVTRTFKRTEVKFLGFNEKTNKGKENTFTLVGTFKTEKEVLTALRVQYSGPDVPIKVLSRKENSCIMGIPELDFYRSAVEILDQNTNKVKQATKTTTKRKAKTKGR